MNATDRIVTAASWGRRSARRKAPLGVLLCGALLLAGCSNGNPLLGKWEIDPTASSPEARMLAGLGLSQVEFFADKALIGSIGAPVTYDIGDGYVLVNGNGQTSKYVVVSSAEIRVDAPMGQKVVYRRVH